MNARYKVASLALALVSASSVGYADPPFGKKPAYLEPLWPIQVACQITNVTCMRVAAFVLENISPWIGDKGLVGAVQAQNAVNAKMTNLEINKADIGWIERTDKALIDSKMNNATSTFLKVRKQAANGTIVEIFAFDQYGLNVAQTDPTQDYNQGDEAKYWRTYMAGPGAIYIDIPRVDDGKNISQASLTITDPATGHAIGAMTVGIDVDRLGK
jgi:hypothetical protein